MSPKIPLSLFFCSLIPVLAAAQTPAPPSDEADQAKVVLRAGAPQWALAIHGGAGTIPKTLPEERKQLRPGDGGVIGVARDGSLALVYNSEGMYRGAADSAGRFEVKIWE